MNRKNKRLTKSTDELAVVRDDNDGTSPVLNGDSESTKSLTIQEVTGLVQNTDLTGRLAMRDRAGSQRVRRTCGLFHKHAAMTSLIF